MLQIGQYNNLTVIKTLDFGVYLDGLQEGEILLPIRQVPENTEIGDVLEVFIYHDSEDRIIATTIKPYAVVGDFIMLKAIAVNQTGAFLDWGLSKDLLVPYSEQQSKIQVDKSYLVHVYLDYVSKRIAATTKLDKYLNNIPPEYEPGQEVDIMIRKETDLGYLAIINKQHQGLLFRNEVFQRLKIGQEMRAYIKQIRDDEKIDLQLQKTGYQHIDNYAQSVLDYLQKNNGSMDITDKSAPELIYETFGMSKKNFKKALGNLYKNRMIEINKDGIKSV